MAERDDPAAADESAPEPPPVPVREGEHVAPEVGRKSFHCPYCGVLAQMTWRETWHERWPRYVPPAPPPVLGTSDPPFERRAMTEAPVLLAWCWNCQEVQVWVGYGENDTRLVKPPVGAAVRSHFDMPADVRADHEEARSIVAMSPRGACALLRLATQKLVNDHLQPEGGDLNDRIRRLVAAGLPVPVQQALDALRVIGNEAVHPGELDLRDDVETANGLFMLMNVIVEDRITRPKHIDEMYAKLPPGKLQGIVNRDRGGQ